MSISYPDTDRTTIYHFSSFPCSHHFLPLVSIPYSGLAMTRLSMLSQKIANDHFVSIVSKQMGLMSSQNLHPKVSFSSHFLVSMDHMYSTVSMSMPSNEPKLSITDSSISSLLHLSSPLSSSILNQEIRSSMSVLHQDPRRHNSL